MDLTLHIHSLAEKIFSGKVTRVQIPGSEGRFEVRKNHAPLVTTLVPGEVTYYNQGSESSIKVSNGMVLVKHNVIYVWF